MENGTRSLPLRLKCERFILYCKYFHIIQLRTHFPTKIRYAQKILTHFKKKSDLRCDKDSKENDIEITVDYVNRTKSRKLSKNPSQGWVRHISDAINVELTINHRY